jgi:PTH2 family peptidyl-tRNA hydrolase
VSDVVEVSGKVKQVLLYRRDLQMRKGKIAAQCAHASLAVFLRRGAIAQGHLLVPLDAAMTQWIEKGSAKVCLSVQDEEALLAAHAAAQAAGLPCAIIRDAGKTEFKGVPTLTALAIGPAPVEAIDAITGPEGLVETKLA